MDVEGFKLRLLEKEQQLLEDIARFDREARESSGEIGDATDEATSSEIQSMALTESSLERQTLTLVRDALRRIHENRFGICVDCGRPIEPARLEAVPWTPYCRGDRERRDAATVGPVRK